MTVLDFTGGSLFVARVIKYLSTNPDNKWANSYEFRARDAGGETEILNMGEALVNFEISQHRTSVVFDRLIISTWLEDSVPYNPASFVSTTLTGVGALEIVDDLVALNQCLTVTRLVGSGRFGHLFYRGRLEEAQVVAPAGISTLTNRAAEQSVLDDGLTDSGFGDYMDTGSDVAFDLVMVNASGTNVRRVIGLRAQGVTTVPMDHAWFNRTPPTP